VSGERLFFALIPEPSLAERLHEQACTLKKYRDERIVKSDMVHMTLRYIGPVTLDIQDCVVKYVDMLNLPSFNVSIDKTGYWKIPKVTWCAPEKTTNNLKVLVEELEVICQRCGIKAVKRPFKPHVTLLKNTKSLHEAPYQVLHDWSVREFVLLASTSIDGGVEYRKIKSWSLG